jgi:UDP-sugar transporter A1/2/3
MHRDHFGTTLLLSLLLAAQIGIHPLLVKRTTPADSLISSSILLAELIKISICCLIVGHRFNKPVLRSILSMKSAASVALVPALLYMIQNYAASFAQRSLSPVLYNLINQSKVLSAALMGYLILKKEQTRCQLFALGLIFCGAAAVVSGSSGNDLRPSGVNGIVSALVASILSGLSGSITDVILLTRGRDPYVFSAQLSILVFSSMIITLLLQLLVSIEQSDLYAMYERGGLFQAAGVTRESWLAILPILSSAIGGILVGQLTKMVGSLRKGFAVSLGVVLSGLLDHDVLDMRILFAIVVAVGGVIIHSLESERIKTS